MVPRELWHHPEIISWCRRFGRKPSEAILDVAYHRHAMLSLKDRERRGRPDILHYSLLNTLESPLARKGLLDVYFSTQEGDVFYVLPGTRLPRSYARWIGVLSKTLRNRGSERIKYVGGIGRFLKRFEHKILLHEKGKTSSMPVNENTLYIIGCFQKGDFREDYGEESRVSISSLSLPAWVVAYEVVASIERKVGLIP